MSGNLTSLRRIILDFDSLHKTSTNGWREKAIKDWLPRGLGLMGLKIAYDLTSITKKATGNRVELPCNSKYIIAVAYNGYRLPVKKGIPKLLQQTALRNYPLSESHRIDLYSGIGHTSFEEGDVTFIYLDFPRDEDGIIMIPDIEQLNEALYWYLMYMMILSQNYKHPELSLQSAMQMWEEKRWTAVSYISFPTPEEMIGFREIMNNGLLYDIDKTFFEL